MYAPPILLLHCYFIAQFSTDISSHVPSHSNIVADALSRVEAGFQAGVDFTALAAYQETNEELQRFLHGDSDLQLKKIVVSSSYAFVFNFHRKALSHNLFGGSQLTP